MKYRLPAFFAFALVLVSSCGQKAEVEGGGLGFVPEKKIFTVPAAGGRVVVKYKSDFVPEIKNDYDFISVESRGYSQTVLVFTENHTTVVRNAVLEFSDEERKVIRMMTFNQQAGSGTVNPEKKYPWPELPVIVKQNSDWKVIKHFNETYSSQQQVRNYTSCYDTRRHNPMWVAYPCHDIYWEGGYTRPKVDPWRPDPELEESEQSIIYPSNWDAWPWDEDYADSYQYWYPVGANNDNRWVSWTRGHMMRSAERGSGNSEVLFPMNVETFYPTNISPERYMYPDHWDRVEYLLPKWKSSDTLFVVVGNYYGDDSVVTWDACNWGNKTSKSKQCIVPQARYKIILSSKSGVTGKNVAELEASQLKAIGFWFPQNTDATVEYTENIPPITDYIFSVSEIERKIGGEFSFFPTVPASVKDSYDISDWYLL